MIRFVKPNEYDNWIELAKEVEHLFGPMTTSEEFQNGIREVIKEENSYGIENQNGDLVGIIAIDRQNSEILWLAVGKDHRGNNIGDKLVKKAIEELKMNEEIYVQTFAESVEEGRGARIIYERNGFVDLKNAGKNPANIETVIMVKRNN